MVCIENNIRKEFPSGADAADSYGEYYIIDSISVEDDTLVLQVHNIESEIEARQEEFLNDYKEKNGRELSFFD